jgi:hypothetical protein
MRAMQWALFQKVMIKLAAVRELDPERDAARYAEQLIENKPHLFARLPGGSEGVVGRMAARTIAIDHLGEICRLPDEVATLERSLEISTMTASERLVRIAGLAYLVCDRDLLRDDLPAGYGLIDDCIALRGARLATPAVNESDRLVEDLLTIQYLTAAAPDELLPAIEGALINAAEVALRTRSLPEHVVGSAIRALVDQPPSEFPATLLLPDLDPAERRRIETPIELRPGQIVEADRGSLVIEYEGGTRLRRSPEGSLSFA